VCPCLRCSQCLSVVSALFLIRRAPMSTLHSYVHSALHSYVHSAPALLCPLCTRICLCTSMSTLHFYVPCSAKRAMGIMTAVYRILLAVYSSLKCNDSAGLPTMLFCSLQHALPQIRLSCTSTCLAMASVRVLLRMCVHLRFGMDQGTSLASHLNPVLANTL